MSAKEGWMVWETPSGFMDVDVRIDPMGGGVGVYGDASDDRPLFISPAGTEAETVKAVLGIYRRAIERGKELGRWELRRELRQLLGAAEVEA